MSPQLLGSVLVALAIMAIAIIAVTAKLGPTSAAEIDAREERLEERLEQQEEQREEQQDRPD
jgi:type II secretory pathway pseudopilin PulG